VLHGQSIAVNQQQCNPAGSYGGGFRLAPQAAAKFSWTAA